MPRKLKIFLDTSAIIAGLNSPTGAAGTILSACISKQVIAVISRQVIEEANRNILLKFPKLITSWQSFLLIPPKIIKDPTLVNISAIYKILPTADAPILASAIEAKPNALITWNTRDFMRPQVTKYVDFPILTPGEFLNSRIFREDRFSH